MTVVSIILHECVVSPLYERRSAVPPAHCISPEPRADAPAPDENTHMKLSPNVPQNDTLVSFLMRYLLVQGFVVLKERFESFEHFHLTGDAGGRLRLTLHYGHSQGALMTRHQTLQMLQQQLRIRKQDSDQLDLNGILTRFDIRHFAAVNGNLRKKENVMVLW